MKYLASLFLSVSLLAQSPWPVPTCDPDNPNCTLDNGCNGKPCMMPTIGLFDTQTSQFVKAHGIK